jgi:hypothetical protein
MIFTNCTVLYRTVLVKIHLIIDEKKRSIPLIFNDLIWWSLLIEREGIEGLSREKQKRRHRGRLLIMKKCFEIKASESRLLLRYRHLWFG